MQNLPISPEMLAELTKWANEARQCKICQAWATLDKEDECMHCKTNRGNWTRISK